MIVITNDRYFRFLYEKSKFLCIVQLQISDREFFANDCICSVKIVYFQPGSYSFSYDRSLEILDLSRIVIFNFHDRVIYHSIKLPASIDRIGDEG